MELIHENYQELEFSDLTEDINKVYVLKHNRDSNRIETGIAYIIKSGQDFLLQGVKLRHGYNDVVSYSHNYSPKNYDYYCRFYLFKDQHNLELYRTYLCNDIIVDYKSDLDDLKSQMYNLTDCRG